MGFTDLLRRGGSAHPISVLSGLVASYLIYADVHTFRWLITTT